MSEEPWDQILDMLDHLANTAATTPNLDVEATFARLISEAIVEGFVDPELHVDDTARWLTAMLAAHRAAREAHPEVPSDDDGAVLRLIVTRWLHPHRLDQREPRT
ncbi:hypothetical protein [Aeromicrobium sp.]|uniref:hypothetical protein n=1 Tax=Aeromicrobium sp. TaxID=1871063 RepID=UPI002FC8639D